MKSVDKQLTLIKDEISKVVEAKSIFVKDFSKFAVIKVMYLRLSYPNMRKSSSVGMTKAERASSLQEMNY